MKNLSFLFWSCFLSVIILSNIFLSSVYGQTSISDPAGTTYSTSCSVNDPGFPGTGPGGSRALGYDNGQVFTITNSGTWPSCLAWGLPTASGIPVVNGSILASSACTFNNVTYTAAAPTDLINGVAAFTGTTNYRASNGTAYGNYAANTRMVVTVTDGGGTPVSLKVVGSYVLAGIPTPGFVLKVKVVIYAQGPAGPFYFTSGTGTPTVPCSNSYTCASYNGTYVGAIQLYNCLATDNTYKICTQFDASGKFFNGFSSSSVSPTFTGGPANNSNQTSPNTATYTWTGTLGNHPTSKYEYSYNGGAWTTSSSGGTGTSQGVTLNLGANTFCVRYYDGCTNTYYPSSTGECRTVYYTPVNACSGTSINWGGNNWTLVGGTVSGTHYNIGTLTQSGTTTISQGCTFSASATNITINGTMDANGKGYTGGNGGAAGGCSGGNCDNGGFHCADKDWCSALTAFGGGPGTAGNGSGGGAIGVSGGNATGTKQQCNSLGDEGGRLCGGGGGGGGRGGCYGNAGGGSSSSGGNGTDPGTCDQSGCGFSCTSTGGAASGTACSGYGTNNGYNTIEMGSGGGGGGGGGRGNVPGTSGGSGGNGGGSIKLIASNIITVAGNINANGTNGGAGGNGGSAGNSGRCCSDIDSGCDEYTYVGTGGGGGGAGGGSGGGIYLESTCGTVNISGTLSAIGGNGGAGGTGGTSGAAGGGGSGGRIKIFYPVNAACNSIPAQGTSVNGGSGFGSGNTGTFYSGTNANTITKGTIGSDQTICSGNTPSGLTSTLDASVSGCSITPVYQWYNCTGGSCAVPSASSSGTPGGSWASIGGATSNSFSPPSLTTTTYYVRRVLLGGCYYWSNRVTITVSPVPTATAGSDIIACTGTAAITLSGASAGGTFGSNTWSGGGGLGTWTQNADPALATFTPSVTAGYFTATLTVYGNAACTGNDPTSTRLIIWGSPGDWIGAVNTDWFNAGNWCSAVPLSTTDANIPSGVPNMPDIGANGAVCKTIAIQAGASLTMSTSDTMTIYGDWDNNGTFNPGTGRVKFSGSAIQLIKGSTATTFKNVSINNPSGITLNSPASISGGLILLDGVINSDATNIFTLTSTSSATEGKATSYINGPVIKQGSTDFIFPVGKGTKWARLGIFNLTASSDFRAEYFDSPYTNITTIASPLEVVSGLEHWVLDQLAGSGDAEVRIYWENAIWSDISTCVQNGDLVVAHWSGGTWNNAGSPTVISGCTGIAPFAGWIQSNQITAFSPFTFGSKNWQSNPLPVILYNFSTECSYLNRANFQVKINWSTVSEVNNDLFIVDRSIDGVNFLPVGEVKGNGNTNSIINYDFIDYPSTESIGQESVLYYRLRQRDFDGKIAASEIVGTSCILGSGSNLNIFPNPAINKVFITINSDEKSNEGELFITDVLGQKYLVQKVSVKNGKSIFEMNTKNLAAGSYFINLQLENGKLFTQKLSVE